MPRPLVGDDELRRTLDGLLPRVAHVRRRPSPYYSSFLMEDLDVTLADGSRHALVLKDLSTGARLEAARRHKPPFLYDPLREARTYAQVLEPEQVGAPKFYGAAEDEAAGRCLLFLGRVDGRPLWQVGEFDLWRLVARWLAGMHGRLRDRIAPRAAAARLLRYDEAYYRVWLKRAVHGVSQRRHELPAGAAAAFDRLAANYDRVIDRLLALPVTFIHGEFYPSNVLIEGQGGATARVRPVDWEMAAVGPGLMDLADLTSGKWTPEQKADLAGAYCAAPAAGGWGQGDFGAALDCCRLHRAMQWLGWSPDWSPPPEHANDWLAEVLRLGEAVTS